MQLTADPQGIAFMNKNAAVKKEKKKQKFCRKEQDMLNISISASPKWDPLVPCKYHKIFMAAVVIGFWALAKQMPLWGVWNLNERVGSSFGTGVVTDVSLEPPSQSNNL